MPYKVATNVEGCNAFAVIKPDTGELVACHNTRGEAAAHVRALYANVPDAIQKESAEVLEQWHSALHEREVTHLSMLAHHYITAELEKRDVRFESDEFHDDEIRLEPISGLDADDLELLLAEDDYTAELVQKWEDGEVESFEVMFAIDMNGMSTFIKSIPAEKAETDTYIPPASVAREAKMALQWIRDGHAGGGFTDVGRARAAQLAARRPVSLRTIKRMNSYLSRHTVDAEAEGFKRGEKGFPSPGRVAWNAWGGDSAKSWVRGILSRAENADKALSNEAPFIKAEEKKFTLGPLYIPNKLDAHGEWTDEEELQKAVWDYVKSDDRRIRLQHNRDIVAGEWVELMTFPYELKVPMTKADGSDMEITYPANTVFMGVLWKDWAWELVKAGKVRGYSIGGKARRLSVDIPYDTEKGEPGVSDVHVDTIMKPRKPLKKSIEDTLQERADEHNKKVGDVKSKRTTPSVLMQVFRRGVGAYKTNPESVRPNVTSPEQWGLGRVDGFLSALRTGRFKSGKFDTDLLPSGHPLSSRKD